ncbi:hypothetical protein NDK43_08840 [Neobacillus pocheonensis]|uniref:Uncharacterized protein n=1 Tax=Neobacillus pocheonensis TaxID=363869 RepID=A0ABT0W817_9BACI|nr:hypothetical protein [Neobacillus pocheonensis]
MFNEFEVYQMMKLRKEETERNAKNAWKVGDIQKETFFQKIIKILKKRHRHEFQNLQTNCGCVCSC